MSLITIGVPTYNRKDIVYKTLMHLINSDLPVEDVEFLVSDNASEDGTFELLSTIKDDRLSLYQNESNINIDGNTYAVLKKAKSSFVLLISDEDYTIIEEVKKLIEELKKDLEYYQKNIGCFMFNANIDENISNVKQIQHIYASGAYFSGEVYNTELLKEIDYEIPHSVYPQLYPAIQLLNISDIIICKSKIYYQGDEMGKEYYIPPYYVLTHRYKQLKLEISMVNNLFRFSKNELFYAILDMYMSKFNSLFVYDLLYRSEFHKNYFKLEKDEFVIEKYMNKFNTFLLDYVEEFYSDKIEETREFINKTNFELYKTLNARYKFELAKLKGYEIVMLRSEVDLLEERGWNLLGMMQHYKYIVDKIVDDTSEITDDQIFLKYNYDIRDHENCKDINWSRLVRGMRKEHTYVQYPKISL